MTDMKEHRTAPNLLKLPPRRFASQLPPLYWRCRNPPNPLHYEPAVIKDKLTLGLVS